MPTTIIIGLWYHRLNLYGFEKPENVRLVVVGPSYCLVDERCVDVLYAVEGPRSFQDHEHGQLIEKIKEICIKHGNDIRRLCVFERTLRKEAAAIRKELEIEGIFPDQLEMLIAMKTMKMRGLRNGLNSIRQCSMMQSHSEDCIKKAKTQLGGFPIFIKPVHPGTKCVHSYTVATNPDELRIWIKEHEHNMNFRSEYLFEEYLSNGHEFTAVCSKTGLIGTIATADQSKTLYECVKTKKPYAIEYLNVEQCRNYLPGIESFVNKAIKSLDLRHFAKNLLFIKGFYKAHNMICFISASFEPRSETDYRLLQEANNSISWEVLHLNCVLEDIGVLQSEPFAPRFPDRYFMAINFPKTEGILLHQTNIPRRNADIRVAWRVSEGEELYDSDSIDDNILQIFISHTDRRCLLAEVTHIMETTQITVDRACIFEEDPITDRPQNHAANHNCDHHCGNIE